MKNNTIKKILTLAVVFTICVVFRADVIPENSHRVDRSVIITNCSSFDNLEFIAYITGPMVDKEFYIVSDNKELYSGYKFNDLQIFGIKKIILDSIGGVDNLDKEYILSKVTPLYFPTSGGYYIYNNYSILNRDDLTYEIAKNSKGQLHAVLKTRKLGFGDGTTQIISY